MKQLYLVFLLFTFVFTGLAQDVDHTHESQYKFLENKGQWPDHIHYCANVDAGKIWLEKGRILYQFSDYSEIHEAHANPNSKLKGSPKLKEKLVFADFVNANKNAKTTHQNPTQEYYNYFLGNDKNKWASNVHAFNTVKYNELYNGIDLTFYEKDQDLKYDFTIDPQAKPSDIVIQYFGAKKIKLNKKGNLIIETEIGQLQEQKPFAYQIKTERS